MSNYVIFKFRSCSQSVSINRANIVGFRVPDGRLVFTKVILDSGCEVALNGMSQEDAEETLCKFDESRKGEDE